MFEKLNEQHKTAIDEILQARHTVRDFNQEIPSREEITAIIQSGLIAPFAALAVAGKPDFRKIIVIPASSAASSKIQQVLQNRLGLFAAELEKKMGLAPFVQNIKRIALQGIPGLKKAPFYIVVGERKGMPPVASQSLCYCLHNMWLKATTLGIGLQLISATSQMDNDPEFCQLIGIPCGEYALDGCVLGYPADNYAIQHTEYPLYDKSVTWM